MSSDDGEGRVIPFPVLGGLRPPIGGGTATSDPPPPPQAPPADPEAESGIVAAFPALAGVQLSPPLALTLPALAPDGEDQAADDDQVPAVHQDGGMTAREAATLGLMVASAITVACLRGTAAFASWCRTRAEHHRTVRAAAAKASSTGGGRVPSSPEYGRATRGGGRGGTGSGGTGGGRSGGGGRAPAAFRSTGSGSRGAGGSTRHGGGTSRTPTASDSGKAGTGGRRRNGSGSGSGSGLLSPGGHRKPKTPKDKSKSKGTGDSGSDGGGKAPRGPKGSKVRKPKGSGSGSGGTSADGSGTSTSRKGKGKGGKEKGDGAKSPATRTPATTPATRGAKARALTRRTTTRAARGGVRLLRRGGGYVVRRTPPTARRVARRTHRVARHVRRWSRVQWERIAARAEARWERRQQAAAAGSTGTAGGPAAPSSGPAAPGTGPTPPGPGAGSHGPGAAPGGPGPDGGPWIGYGPLTPPPAMTDPYAVTFERIDVQEQEDEPVPAELVVADGDTPPADAPPGQTWEPLRGVDGGWVLVDVAELVEPDPGPISIPAARTEAAPSKEAASVTNRPPAQATPSALAQGVAAMSAPHYDSGASELTIYDLLDADQDAAEEIVARVETAREDAKAARALVGHMEALKATCIQYKIPGALYRYACRLQEKAGALAADADALAKSLPAASEAISAAGKNAAARHKPLADTVRDHGHAAPAEADYHG
ncbi:hypothetical protein ACIRPR_33720 [Streptomyces griseoflavus]|uniref:hypothetical protein n=1 Tax=Streptomyces griseoflavus TaxID=35619 RepID=UPI003819F617